MAGRHACAAILLSQSILASVCEPIITYSQYLLQISAVSFICHSNRLTTRELQHVSSQFILTIQLFIGKCILVQRCAGLNVVTHPGQSKKNAGSALSIFKNIQRYLLSCSNLSLTCLIIHVRACDCPAIHGAAAGRVLLLHHRSFVYSSLEYSIFFDHFELSKLCCSKIPAICCQRVGNTHPRIIHHLLKVEKFGKL